MATAIALQFIPGPGTAAGASILGQVGAYFSSSQGLIVAANAVAQGVIASRHGNMNEVFAGVANGLLLAATGPFGLSGSISYTPPQKANSLGDLIDVGMNGASASGWGGGISIGGSKLNGGVSFSPGSGIDLNIGGTLGGAGGFYNLSYNTSSGNTSGSIGAGQEYGSNFGINLSTDHNQTPSIFAGFGCDVNGTNCGGGKNALGVGGSITLNGDGTVNLGADLLGNQGLGVTYDSNTGSWSAVTVESDWAKNFTYMNAQNVADAVKKKADDEIYKKYAEVASDPNILNNSEAMKKLSQAMGITPKELGDMISNTKLAIDSGNEAQAAGAKQLLDSVMKLIHDEAYTGDTPNKDLQAAITNSKAVAKVDSGSSEGKFLGDLGTQAKIYFNQLAGNAFGEFAYVNENGDVVFRLPDDNPNLHDVEAGYLIPISQGEYMDSEGYVWVEGQGDSLIKKDSAPDFQLMGRTETKSKLDAVLDKIHSDLVPAGKPSFWEDPNTAVWDWVAEKTKDALLSLTPDFVQKAASVFKIGQAMKDHLDKVNSVADLYRPLIDETKDLYRSSMSLMNEERKAKINDIETQIETLRSQDDPFGVFSKSAYDLEDYKISVNNGYLDSISDLKRKMRNLDGLEIGIDMKKLATSDSLFYEIRSHLNGLGDFSGDSAYLQNYEATRSLLNKTKDFAESYRLFKYLQANDDGNVNVPGDKSGLKGAAMGIIKDMTAEKYFEYLKALNQKNKMETPTIYEGF
ncbi:hypothetical protein CH365_19755 [Leptospira neocaledonica]|uniref:TIGR04388 family protein n=2 Tax=Leptospira neocaledonica TaxID=2023192 RepID=A0A2M9ZTQ0_9LEPT|nr:hypothetical protein CH365_19755 [Leptospira neocaledonica]